MNFVVSLPHHRVSVAQWWSIGAPRLNLSSSWGLRFLFLTHACDKTKNIILYFFTELKTYHLFYSIN